MVNSVGTTEAIVNVHLKDHVAYVEEQLQKIDGPVVLAAHSMTGMVISQVADDFIGVMKSQRHLYYENMGFAFDTFYIIVLEAVAVFSVME